MQGNFYENDADGSQRQMDWMMSLELKSGDRIHLYNDHEHTLYFFPDASPVTFTVKKSM